MRVALNPGPPKDIRGGIDAVVHAMWRFLPQYGVELTPWGKPADILATHVLNPDRKGLRADVLHCHGLYPTGSNPGLESWTWAVNHDVIAAVRSAVAVTVPSEWVADIFARAMSFRPFVVPHGIDISEWPTPYTVDDSYVLWNKNRPGDVCSTEPMNKLAAMCPEQRFVTTYGDAAHNVQVIGFVPHERMVKLLYGAAVYLATTKETFGIGIIEAMAAGAPVLTWGWGNAPYLVRHKVDGYVAVPGDYDDLRDGLAFCLEHRQELAPNARERALAYSWDNAMDLYRGVYEFALGTKLSRVEPLVDIVIPCYNYGRYVGEAIGSVKNQTYPKISCYVVDDGSTDNSREQILAAARGDSRIHAIFRDNGGVASARNTGAMAGSAPFLCFLDADDILEPTAVTNLLSAFRKDPGLGIAYGSLQAVGASGLAGRLASKSTWPGEFNFEQQLQKRNQVPSFCMMRREAFLRAGGYRQHTAPAEDAELWTRIGLVGYNAKKATQRVTYRYRVHDSSASAEVRRGNKPDPDWLAWLPAANGAAQPFGSIAESKEKPSHPVYEYDMPVLSIVIVVSSYHRDILERAIESVAAQTSPEWELIVVDDVESGGLPEYGVIPYRTKYPWVRWVHNGGKRGPGAARNVGARAARGTYLCFLDADDELERGFVDSTVPVAEDCPEHMAMVYTDWLSMPDGIERTSEPWDVNRLRIKSLFPVTFVHTKKLWSDSHGFDEDIEGWEDWDYTLRLAMLGAHGVRVPQVLMRYYMDSGRRREESLAKKNQLLQQVRTKYEGQVPMPKKCGCHSVAKLNTSRAAPVTAAKENTPPNPVTPQPSSQRVRTPQAVATPPSPGTIAVELTANIAPRLYRTPGGRQYRVGGADRVVYVPPEDVAYFLRLPGFRVKGAAGGSR